MLSDLGRREEALEATSEAVECYRLLTRSRPDNFHPGLVTSLNNLSSDLIALGRTEDALTTIEEAVRTLAPSFLRLPVAFEHWMAILVQNYCQLAQHAGRPVDGEFLRPVVELLGTDIEQWTPNTP